MTVSIVDVSNDCGRRAAALYAAGVRTLIRYYSRDTIRPSKRLGLDEAQDLSKAGLRLCIVHEGRFGDRAENFDRSTGVADALYARSYGAVMTGQPSASAIYFGVDFDATTAEIRDRIVPYFQGVADAFAKETGGLEYAIGVYGSGATCKAVLDARLARYAWLAQSTGWTGYSAFLKSGRWALHQGMPTTIAGVACDPNEPGADRDIGDFAMPKQTSAASGKTQMRVNARDGLRLRVGPGIEFDSSQLLPLGTAVHPMKTIGPWTMVDLQGDGVADGFVSGAYLAEIDSSGAAPLIGSASSATSTADAPHVAELIRQGSSVDGLKKARKTAAASLPGYPTNGCAAHLSALLEQSGVGVEMTFGAGKLAHTLSERRWTRVGIGQQLPGDVGVCYDNNPSPPGSDHIYLVVSTSGPDEMMIADNQRTTDAPHVRYASGHGKTPTEYFLRAE